MNMNLQEDTDYYFSPCNDLSLVAFFDSKTEANCNGEWCSFLKYIDFHASFDFSMCTVKFFLHLISNMHYTLI